MINQTTQQGFYELKKKKDQLQAERNELCRKEMSLQQSLSALKEELSKADQSLRSMAGKPILNGRDSVRKVLQAFKVSFEWLVTRLVISFTGCTISLGNDY